MKREIILTHEFVEYIPNDLKDRTIYVSMAFAIVVHKCCCGCGNEVITPLSPTDWKLIFDGQSISLEPSIGNWNFPCRSHYWIKCNRSKWMPRWSLKDINAGRTSDAFMKKRYFSIKTPTVHKKIIGVGRAGKGISKENLWRKLKKLFF